MGFLTARGYRAAKARPASEAVNGLYKTELIRRRDPWRTVEQVELATLEYVWRWNNQRLHGELNMRTPAEAEPTIALASTHPRGQPVSQTEHSPR